MVCLRTELYKFVFVFYYVILFARCSRALTYLFDFTSALFYFGFFLLFVFFLFHSLTFRLLRILNIYFFNLILWDYHNFIIRIMSLACELKWNRVNSFLFFLKNNFIFFLILNFLEIEFFNICFFFLCAEQRDHVFFYVLIFFILYNTVFFM